MPGPAGPEGKDIGAVPQLCSICCAELDTIHPHIPSLSNTKDSDAHEDSEPGKPRPIRAQDGQGTVLPNQGSSSTKGKNGMRGMDLSPSSTANLP